MLYFNDLRIFGWIKVVEKSKLNEVIGKLGPEPFVTKSSSGQAVLTLDLFKKILAKNSRPIKLVLMDQEKISGVGNIYANDSLFLAGIHPRKKANKQSSDKANKLFNALYKVLTDGIKWGGASENNYRDAFGEKGRVQEHFYVYAREGEKCLKCGTLIQKIKLGGRGTYFCPKCQRYK